MTKKEEAYNPLDRINLAKSIEIELLARPVELLSAADQATGAGVYVIYYTGSFPAYAAIAAENRDGKFARPIYIGKAIPKGGRKGGLSTDTSAVGRALGDRLKQHATSIAEADNLELADFHVRHLVVSDIWIPLGENMLIETFKPVWNRAIDGFGNKDPGKRRATQFRSPWDMLHPGRQFAVKLADSPATAEFLLKRVEDYFAGRPLAKLPKAVEKQQAEEEADADDAADQV
jgi:Eco29kI restriction endonuclease